MFITTTKNHDIVRTSVDDIKRNITPLDFEPIPASDTIKIPLHKVGLLDTDLLIDPVARTAQIESRNPDYVNQLISEPDKQALFNWLDSLTIHRTPQAEINHIIEQETAKRKRM